MRDGIRGSPESRKRVILSAAPGGKTGWRGVITRMLEAMGFIVRLTKSGSETLDVFLDYRHEIVGVLLDFTMPQLDGAATFTELRRINPDIRVLLMSGLAGFIQKPFKPETLQTKLQAIFETKGI